MLRVLTFGNPYLENDSLAVKVAQGLDIEGVEFIVTANLNDLLGTDYDAIMDVAYGVPRVVLLDDLERLREHRLVSLHDYDVTYFLKLLKAMGGLQKVRIIAIPVSQQLGEAMNQVTAMLHDLLKEKTR
jgi:Ni,Fe-hydrogenase maturation factor